MPQSRTKKGARRTTKVFQRQFKLVLPNYLFLMLMLMTTLSTLISCKDANQIVTTAEAEKIFAYEVYPLLEAKCFACHGDDPAEIEGDFDIRSLEGMLKGGESGNPGLVPGNPQKSPIYVAAHRSNPDFLMPPKENDKLTEDQLKWLYQWIAGQAPWPEEVRRKELIAADDWDHGGTVAVKTSTPRSETWGRRRYQPEDLWAFSPMRMPEIPQDFVEGETTNPIDAFIDQQLAIHDLKPAPKADPVTLLRRATYDLMGLPPTPKELDGFLADDSPYAFESAVNRLLANPHYGEQWGRHWLDVVRYADTDGFANDYSRPNAWRYRDYVIRSFNEDKPYDQFIREQIAGDEINPNDPEMLIAAGFLRMGPWEHTGMSVAAETRQYFLDDVTNSVGETFLSLPLRCARCHDHKFDPIPTKDFYRIQAVFATTQFADRIAPFLPKENLNRFEEEKERIKAWIEEAELEQEKIKAKEEDAAKQWFRDRGKAYIKKRARRKLPDDQQPPRYLGLTDQDLGYRKLLDKRKQTLNRKKGRFEGFAFSVYNGPAITQHSARPMRLPETIEGQPEPSFILTGGSVHTPDESVSPGVLSAIATLDTIYNPTDTLVPNSLDKRRSAFARWLTHPQHPLTARSIVNRVWQYHFGVGLAENSNNFGITGKKPTHPKLLDWLAIHFVEKGWSIKYLHKLIMSSKAYQRSSQHPNIQKVRTLDPENKWLAVFRPRRLEAEELRDAMLWVSGELNPELGGIPIRPEINLEVALQPRHIMGSIAPAYQPSPLPQDRNRRTIYAEKYRNMPDPMLAVFNQPGSELSCERRTTSSVSPQAFTLLNSRNSQDRSIAFAHRILQEKGSLENQIAWAISRVWNRPATDQELRDSKAFVEKMIDHHTNNPPVEEAYPIEVERSMFEEMTGAIFTYTEQLDIYKNYTPDLKPWEVDAQTRAMADLALVLFNSNEFVYVY